MAILRLALPTTFEGLLHAVCLTLAAYIALTIAKERYFSPLARIPGPFLNSVSSLPRIVDSILGRAAYVNHALFEMYGPVVRVEPNMIMLADPKYMKTIYGYGSGFYKTEFYTAFTFDAHDKATMSIMNNREHAAKRALYARCMTKASILAQQRYVQDRCEAMVQAVTRRARMNNGKIDMVKEMSFFAHDVRTLVTMGQNFQTIEAGERDTLGRDLYFGTICAFIGSFPIVDFLARCIPIATVQDFMSTMKKLSNHGHRILREYRQLPVNEQKDFRVFHELNEDARRLGYQDTTIVNEIISLLAAGGDTTKWLLSYFTHEAFRRPELLKRLQEEVDGVMPDSDTCVDYETASKLPVLNATIKEVLRYYSAVPGPLPRYVPDGDGLIVDDRYVIPAGTQVALQPYTVHRDREIFGDDADDFNPDRWLRDPISAEVMSRNLLSFGYGGRRCIGIELAWLALTLASASIIRNFEGRPADLGSAVAPMDYFVIYSKTGKMELEKMHRRA